MGGGKSFLLLARCVKGLYNIDIPPPYTLYTNHWKYKVKIRSLRRRRVSKAVSADINLLLLAQCVKALYSVNKPPSDTLYTNHWKYKVKEIATNEEWSSLVQLRLILAVISPMCTTFMWHSNTFFGLKFRPQAGQWYPKREQLLGGIPIHLYWSQNSAQSEPVVPPICTAFRWRSCRSNTFHFKYSPQVGQWTP